MDTIGFYGPHILLGANSILLWPQRPYLQAFLGGFLINTGINQVLKQWIKQERPNKTTAENGYGMPSLHSQSVWYSTLFLYWIKQSMNLLIIEVLLCLVTMYQRWKTEMHSSEQIIVGSLLGGLFSYGMYELTRQRLEDSGDSYRNIL
jgi:membrane-associated phospholipid phosphatase